MTPFEDFVYLINHVLLGEEPTIEDFILLVGTLVAFIAFILWCCFPIQPKTHIKAFDAATAAGNSQPNAGNAATAAGTTASNSSSNNCNGSASVGMTSGSLSNNTQYNGANGSYSKNGTVAMHNYYVKNGHHCCT